MEKKDCIYRVAELVVRLKSENLKISVAESCTGGALSSKIISIPGASEVFYEGIVAYNSEAKIKRLNVSRESIETYGVVSRQTAKEMVKGLETEVAISTTGIGGPSGGTLKHPVGTVYIGVRVFHKVVVKKYLFQGDREEIQEKAVDAGIKLVLKILDE